MNRNLQMNPDLRRLIEVVPNPLWSESGRPLFFTDDGPGSRVSFEKMDSDEKIETISIDDFVRRNGIARIDFIKMDIEGAELSALQGASATIRTFKPKLAISVYHRPTDITTIPAWIESCGVPYEIYLGHYTIHNDETVLFAIPKAS
jgi:FkbM family methyltransferase